jgi:hypothetical protein
MRIRLLMLLLLTVTACGPSRPARVDPGFAGPLPRAAYDREASLAPGAIAGRAVGYYLDEERRRLRILQNGRSALPGAIKNEAATMLFDSYRGASTPGERAAMMRRSAFQWSQIARIAVLDGGRR